MSATDISNNSIDLSSNNMSVLRENIVDLSSTNNIYQIVQDKIPSNNTIIETSLHKLFENQHINNNNTNTDEIESSSSLSESTKSKNNTLEGESDKWFQQKEYIIFMNELKSLKRNNIFVLKECKENKRLLDLKFSDLTSYINNIQTSVIFFSTISGFLQATRQQFTLSDTIVSVTSICISTYISLLLSISKYYKLDELKERISNLREKYSVLHNKIEYRMDILGPWGDKKLWIHQDANKKLAEWAEIRDFMNEDYKTLIQTKQDLMTEYEIIMDTKSRNTYHIKNRERNYKNREKIFEWDQKEAALEDKIYEMQQKNARKKRPSIMLQHEELDNWDESSSV